MFPRVGRRLDERTEETRQPVLLREPKRRTPKVDTYGYYITETERGTG